MTRTHAFIHFMMVVMIGVLPSFSFNTLNVGVEAYESARGSNDTDWIVSDETRIANQTIILDGNLVIQSGGKLTFDNVTLIMNCTYGGQYRINVKSGGAFYIYNNSYISSADVNNTRFREFRVENGSSFTMKDSELRGCSRALVVATCDVIIDNCTFSNNFDGVVFNAATNCTLTNCNISNNDYVGVELTSSSNTTLANNTCYNNTYGIRIYDSPRNMLRDNALINNTNGLYIRGKDAADFTGYHQDIDSSNSVNGKPIYYLIEQADTVLDEWANVGYLALISCENITLRNLTFDERSSGVLLVNTSYSTITNYSCESSSYGIILKCSHNNKIADCVIRSCRGDGVDIYESYNNTIVNCSLYNNGGHGIDASYSSNNAILNCNLSGNGIGIELYLASNNTVAGCEISNNRRGIFIFDGTNNLIINTTFYDNDKGLYCKHASLTVLNSTVDSTTYDFYLYDGSDVKAFNTTFNLSKVHIEDYGSTLTLHDRVLRGERLDYGYRLNISKLVLIAAVVALVCAALSIGVFRYASRRHRDAQAAQAIPARLNPGVIIGIFVLSMIVASILAIPVFFVLLIYVYQGSLFDIAALMRFLLSPGPLLAMLVIQDATLVGVFYLLVVRGKPLSLREVGCTMRALLPNIGIGIGVGSAFSACSALLELALFGEYSMSPAFSPPDFTGYLLILFAIAVVAPLSEEFVFRGIAFNGVLKYYRAKGDTHAFALALLFSTMFFTGLHVFQYAELGTQAIYAVAQTIVAGVVLALLLHKTRSLTAPILVHSIINAGALSLAYFNVL